MLTTIIKRNGNTEPFTPSKINKWGEWAAVKLGDRVDWSSVVLDVVKHFSGTVSSQTLQKELINQCLYRKDWPHNLMAGRLYAATLRKELYDEYIPTVKALFNKLYKMGLMKELNYSDKEWKEVETFIDHNRDFDYAHFQIHQIRKKYAIQNRVTKEEFETPQFTFMRMAMALGETEPVSERMMHVKNWYDHLSLNRMNAPSPNYINLGTNHNGYASCCLYTVGDDAASLAIGDHIAYKMTCMSAGIGGFINVRSIGDEVRGGSIVHQGKLPYYNALAGAVKANIQAGRGGACTTYYSAFDPEAETIALLQNPRTPEDRRNRDIHFAMMTNRLFAKKVARNEDIFTFTVYSAPDLMELLFSGDMDAFEALYNKYEADENFKKNYVNARELLITGFQQSFEVATHYWAQIDEINRHTPFKEKIHSSNLCVAPETPILTKEFGYREIATLKDKEVHVWNGEQWSKTIVRKTGENQKLLLVTTSGGTVLEVTPYHKWYVQEQNELGAKTSIIEKRTHELNIGDKLIKYDLDVCDHGSEEFPMAYENGFFTGDGTNINNGIRRIYLYNDKQKLFSLFNTENGICSYRQNINANIGNLRTEIDYRKDVLFDKFTIPNNSYSIQSRLKWLSGLYDADGCLTNNQGTSSLQLVSVNFDFLYRLRLMFQELGIRSKIIKAMDSGFKPMPDQKGGSKIYYCKDSWRILISNYDLSKLIELGFKLNRIDLSEVRPGNRECNQFEKITFIADKGRYDDTYCFTEQKRNMGTFSGILTGQCLEVTNITAPYTNMMDLYSEEDHGRGEVGMCSLGGVVECNIDSDEIYESVAYYNLKMIDKCIHMSDYPLPHIGFTAKRRLNASVGLLGVATTMARKNLKYSSKEGKEELHRIAERHAYFCIKGSLRLGKELGNAPWIHKTKWPEGWLPIDTYKKTVDEIVSIPYQYDWETLRADIIENKGIRNSSVIAHMPTESSSKSSGIPNSFYPIRDISMKKSDSANIVDWCAMDNDIIGHQYEIAWNIPSNDMIDCYAIVQKFTDQAISADLYKDRSENPELSTKDIVNEYLRMVKYGMKTRYYQNSLTSSQNKGQSNNVGCSSGACTL